MKNLNEAYVIVEQFSSSQYDFFKNFISFDRQEIDKKCKEMNTEENEKFKKKYSKYQKEKFVPTIIYLVKNLEEAIDMEMMLRKQIWNKMNLGNI